MPERIKDVLEVLEFDGYLRPATMATFSLHTCSRTGGQHVSGDIT